MSVPTKNVRVGTKMSISEEAIWGVEQYYHH